MVKEYKCPYCKMYNYASSSKKAGKFTSWKQVRAHTSRCKDNNRSYVIHEVVGPILVEELINTDVRVLRKKYNIHFAHLLDSLRLRGISLPNFNEKLKYSDIDILNSIKQFVDMHGKLPAYRDFKHNSPCSTTICERFGTWNSALVAAGFTPNTQNGFGTTTRGLDGYLYRSQAEAYFADTFLYNKYTYEIEPKYPKPYARWYDWYIKELDLYVELDGGIRPEVIILKKQINSKLQRKCLFVTVTDIYNKNFQI